MFSRRRSSPRSAPPRLSAEGGADAMMPQHTTATNLHDPPPVTVTHLPTLMRTVSEEDAIMSIPCCWEGRIANLSRAELSVATPVFNLAALSFVTTTGTLSSTDTMSRAPGSHQHPSEEDADDGSRTPPDVTATRLLRPISCPHTLHQQHLNHQHHPYHHHHHNNNHHPHQQQHQHMHMHTAHKDQLAAAYSADWSLLTTPDSLSPHLTMVGGGGGGGSSWGCPTPLDGGSAAAGGGGCGTHHTMVSLATSEPGTPTTRHAGSSHRWLHSANESFEEIYTHRSVSSLPQSNSYAPSQCGAACYTSNSNSNSKGEAAEGHPLHYQQQQTQHNNMPFSPSSSCDECAPQRAAYLLATDAALLGYCDSDELDGSTATPPDALQVAVTTTQALMSVAWDVLREHVLHHWYPQLRLVLGVRRMSDGSAAVKETAFPRRYYNRQQQQRRRKRSSRRQSSWGSGSGGATRPWALTADLFVSSLHSVLIFLL